MGSPEYRRENRDWYRILPPTPHDDYTNSQRNTSQFYQSQNTKIKLRGGGGRKIQMYRRYNLQI